MSTFPIYIPINIWALLAATAARMLVGSIWYSPVCFSNPWMRAVHCSPEEMKARMPKALPADLLASFIMAFVLLHAVYYAGASTALQGALVGFLAWLGFVATIGVATTLYEKKTWLIFFITGGFQLISLLLMGALLAAWPR